MMKCLLSDEFMKDLKTGFLYSLLEYVRNDDTLMLAIRKGYINIYYRGGNILRLTENSRHNYEAFFDANHVSKSTRHLPTLPSQLSSPEHIIQWIESFPILKQIMDFWFSKNPKIERKFQQLVVRENNYSPVSNETERVFTHG